MEDVVVQGESEVVRQVGSRRAEGTMLSFEQQSIVELVVGKKKSVFFTGSAGTGKTVVLRAIVDSLRRIHAKDPERVAITASTGLAACSIGGSTLHRYAGIGLGSGSVAELVKKIRMDRKALGRWRKCEVLIIDEISMVDGVLFDKLESISRVLRRNSLPFGGIQLVATGDFFQLPPVGRGSSNPTFVFDAESWATSIHRTVLLTSVFRQRDHGMSSCFGVWRSILLTSIAFASMLDELRVGVVTAKTEGCLRRLDRPLVKGCIQATELFPTRRQVDFANATKMRGLSGRTMVYVADEGGKAPNVASLLEHCMAPRSLELKLGAQVMLIKNLDETLVNGVVGTVRDFRSESSYEDDEYESEQFANEIGEEFVEVKRGRHQGMPHAAKRWPVVVFPTRDGVDKEILCMPEDWKVEQPAGVVQACRRQVPLILAWALSIHKAQGQTLDLVKVDLEGTFETGQAYVALSRATTIDGLWVRNFQPGRIKVSSRVVEFYRSLQRGSGDDGH